MTEQASGAHVPAAVAPGRLLDRLGARVIDFVLLAVAQAIVVDLVVVRAILGHDGGLYSDSAGYTDAAVSAVLGAAIQLGYFSLMEAQEGRTVGKSVLRLRTLGPEGDRPTLEQAVRRNIWTAFGILGVVPVVGGLVGGLASLVAAIAIAFGISSDTVTRQGWHDRFAGGTRVVKESRVR